MKDYIVRATAANHQIRAFAVTSRELVEQARIYHNTSPIMTAALGRLLTGGAMMGVMMKGEQDLLTLQIKCGGPAKGMTVTADSRGNVKGYPHVPDVMLPPNEKGKLDVGGALGPGILSVIKDMGLRDPYVGQVALQTSEIAEDLTYYFATSEQVPSAVGLGVLMNKDNTVKQAGGFIVQLMPFTEEAVVAALEEKVASVTSVTDLLEQGLSPETLLERILGEFGLEITDKIPAAYHCNCSRDRVTKAIVSIGVNDIQEMIEDNEPIEVNCQFCDKHYIFTPEDLKMLLDTQW
ncbi:Hsp33 family molecular chaperone HslO [Petralouisia muris]|uniref:Hsp33 family molecular chaperone HslO n=1 Tax=Petralouisia muris TaxID=3032872 RepID=A0AC61S0V7_9FIRM|nr:Hsp33 family molecular chaperone HslO [Petralouisia muris]TGY97964.1 Hsp33 family molecular chaperone HslO [Petralouisia muris]